MLALISVLGSMPLIVLTGVLGIQTGKDNPAFTPATMVALLVAIVLAIVVSVIAMCALYLRIESPVEERVSATFAKARPYFWRYLGVSILTALVVIGFSLLLIIPGIIFAVYYSLVEYPVLFEGSSPHKALGRSRQLVKGYWWAVVGRSVFIGILFVIVAIIFWLAGTVFEDGGRGASIWQLMQNIVFSFFGPLAVIYEYSIYKELKAIKDASTT